MSPQPDPILIELAKLLARSAAARDVSSSLSKVHSNENRTLRPLQQRPAK
jgi:hypothetical protein